jgi:hypothetical protein
MKFKAIILSLLTFVGNTSASLAQDAGEIIKNHIEAIGGFEKINNLKSIIIKQTVSVQNYDIPQTITMVLGESLKTETNTMGNIAIVCVNGESGWQINPAQNGNNNPVELDAKQVKSIKKQADVFGPIVSYEKSGIVITIEGQEQIDKQECFKLKLAKGENESFVFLSKNTFLITKIQNKSQEVYYYDYKSINGYLLPTEVQVITPNAKVTISDRSFYINPKLVESTFKAPTE